MRTVILLLIIVLLAPLAKPHIQDALFMIHLMRQSPSTSLPVPVEGVSERQLTDTWRAPRSEGREHQGVDIFAPKGTPVQSTTRGVVWKIGQNRLGGNVVWILGPGGRLHYYARLDHFSHIKPRDRIEQGTIVGYVGNTGNARGTHPHLHYGIYSMTGSGQNPYPLLLKLPSRAS
jgi:peptidoglycan LD-endopeptidase LytH